MAAHAIARCDAIDPRLARGAIVAVMSRLVLRYENGARNRRFPLPSISANLVNPRRHHRISPWVIRSESIMSRARSDPV